MKLTARQWAALGGTALAAFLAIYVARKGVSGAAAAAAEAAGRVVVDAATGAVIGVGKVIGVPATEATACSRAMEEGRTWDASFACPAGTFIRYLREGAPVNQRILDPRDAMALGGLDPAWSHPQTLIALGGLALAGLTYYEARRARRGNRQARR